MPVIKVCQALVDRIIAASTYVHQPPSFVARDWRFSEYPPSAQALTGAWIELLASPHKAKDITEGIVELAMTRPLHQPYDTINAIGLLLTGLPSSFQVFAFNFVVFLFVYFRVHFLIKLLNHLIGFNLSMVNHQCYLKPLAKKFIYIRKVEYLQCLL